MSKNNANTKKPKNCPGKENLARMNYLYQISQLTANVSPGASAFYSNLMANIAKRSVLRIDPHIKRTLCQRCRTILIPGSMCKIRTSKKDNMIYHRCTKCHFLRKYLLNKNHKLHSDKDDAIVEYLDYGYSEHPVEKQEIQ